MIAGFLNQQQYHWLETWLLKLQLYFFFRLFPASEGMYDPQGCTENTFLHHPHGMVRDSSTCTSRLCSSSTITIYYQSMLTKIPPPPALPLPPRGMKGGVLYRARHWPTAQDWITPRLRRREHTFWLPHAPLQNSSLLSKNYRQATKSQT